MQQTKEINALLSLIDDPDEEVYSTVSERITFYGKGIIPNLENLWENTTNEEVQERIEQIIHRLHYCDLKNDLTEWSHSSCPDLLIGALLVAKFQYPDLQTTPVIQEMEKIKRNIWLELNSFLTPLEKANIFTSILYNYYNLKGTEINYKQPDDFFINKVLQSKKGNTLSIGILYLVFSEMLELPVKAINIPRQFVLGYLTNEKETSYQTNLQHHIRFYIDPTTGQPFSHTDMENYFKRLSVPVVPSYFKPLNAKRIVQILLEELSRCYETGEEHFKQQELLSLCALLD